jgi:gamma-glutamyltranspeptidase/glutathione hydrolase
MAAKIQARPVWSGVDWAVRLVAWGLFFWGNQAMTIAAEPRLPEGFPGYDRPSAVRQQSRSVVIARHGVVATSQPLAAQAGLDVLKAGGNAIDAAITTNAMLSVVEPMSCGIGGDLFVLYWDNRTQKLYGLNASGRSPAKLNAGALRAKGLSQIPLTGPLSWSVPGCVDGWHELLARFGTKPLAELLAPAIVAAEDGFPVSEIIAAGWRGSVRGLSPWPDSMRCYLPEGRGPAEGEIVHLPEYAATLKLLATSGREAFYRGTIADQIVQFSAANGGYFSKEDFAEHRSEWVEPVSTSYRGYDVWQLPPNGQGLAVLQMLNLLEPFDLKAWGPGHPDLIHRIVESKKLAYADRARFYADPAFGQLPIRELLSKTYAASRLKLIDPAKALVNVDHGDPLAGHGDTVYLTVVDKDRNCVSFIQSIFHGFGSQVVPGKLGFALQNRGALFSLEDGHPNRLEPKKRPFHTIIPGFVTKEGKPFFSFGVMGGDMQPQGQVQVLINLLDFGLNPQAAGDAARVQHFGSQTPTGSPMSAGGGTVACESGIPLETIQALRSRGHEVIRATGSFGGYQGILIDHAHGTLHGATDPRKDGSAVGY